VTVGAEKPASDCLAALPNVAGLAQKVPVRPVGAHLQPSALTINLLSSGRPAGHDLFPQGAWGLADDSSGIAVLDALRKRCQPLRQPVGPSLGLDDQCWKLSNHRQPPRWLSMLGIARRSPALTGPPCSPSSSARAIEGANLGGGRRRSKQAIEPVAVQPPPHSTGVTVAPPPSGCSNAWQQPALGRDQQRCRCPPNTGVLLETRPTPHALIPTRLAGLAAARQRRSDWPCAGGAQRWSLQQPSDGFGASPQQRGPWW